jgi:hypothetical protein
MDPTSPNYQQMMIQALMGQGAAAPGTAGQNASSPYGQSFITGNQMMPTAAMLGAYPPSSSQSPYGMLTGISPASQVLQQPMATYG